MHIDCSIAINTKIFRMKSNSFFVVTVSPKSGFFKVFFLQVRLIAVVFFSYGSCADRLRERQMRILVVNNQEDLYCTTVDKCG